LLDSRLKPGQITALLFANDEEFVASLSKTVVYYSEEDKNVAEKVSFSVAPIQVVNSEAGGIVNVRQIYNVVFRPVPSIKGSFDVWTEFTPISPTPPVVKVCASEGTGSGYTIYFDKDKTTFDPKALQALRTLTDDLDKDNSKRVTVNCYQRRNAADGTSAQYGEAIRVHLVGNKGIDNSRILVKSYGTNHNFLKCSDRVEIILQSF
jgi:outer membrane protein OmpA-like peptidoglycan-associated protein